MSDWNSSGSDGGSSDGGFKDLSGGMDGGLSDSDGDGMQEVSHRSWFDRIKSALVGVLVGIVLIPGSCWLLFWNEGRAVTTARSLSEGAGLVLTVPADRVDPANDGKLVYVTAPLRVPGTLTDPTFSFVQAANGVRRIRTVEMYQWRENRREETRNRAGGGQDRVTTYSYDHVWSSSVINSSNFRQSGHNNPTRMAHSSNTLTAQQGTLGGFRLTQEQLQNFGRPVRIALDGNLPIIRDNNGRVADNILYIGGDPNSPHVGDLRVTFTAVTATTASIIGRQTGDGFTAYQTRAGDRLLMINEGTVPSEQIFRAAEDQNRVLTWVLRLVGLIVMAIGFTMIMAPLGVLADVIPLFGDIVRLGTGLIGLALTFLIGPFVMAVAWFWFRPMVAGIVMVVGIAIAAGISALATRRARTRAAASAARMPPPMPPMAPPQQPMQGWGR